MSDDADYSGLYRRYPSQDRRSEFHGDRRLDSGVLLEGTFDEFVRDVRAAITVWPMFPWLPIVSAFVGGGGVSSFDPTATDSGGATSFPLAPVLLAGGAVLGFALALFSLGWSGSERWVYSRAWAREDVSFGDAFSATWRFVGRFIVLGLIVIIPMIILSLLLNAMLGTRLGGLIPGFLLFVILTFVVPSLAYDEERASDAFRAGWAVLRRQGRRAAWYALLPAAVLTGIQALAGVPGVTGWVAYPVGGLVALALKGAIAAAYLRVTAMPPRSDVYPVTAM